MEDFKRRHVQEPVKPKAVITTPTEVIERSSPLVDAVTDEAILLDRFRERQPVTDPFALPLESRKQLVGF